jgi:hypothetical protein
MRRLEDPSRARIPAAPGLFVRWLALALLAGLAALVTALVWQEIAAWPLYVAAGALGALFLVGVLRGRTVTDTGALIRQSEAGWAALHAELARSRRHDRRFAILTIPKGVWSAPDSTTEEGIDAGFRAATAVYGLLRRPDRAWTDGTTLHVLVTDCDRQQAWAFLQRARLGMPQLFAVEGVRLAIFPDDGITLGALLATAGADEVAAPIRATEP